MQCNYLFVSSLYIYWITIKPRMKLKRRSNFTLYRIKIMKGYQPKLA